MGLQEVLHRYDIYRP